MSTKYNNLEELRRKKALIKQEVSDLEALLKFKDKKESLSAFTNGFTDQFLEEKITSDGDTKLAIKTKNVVNHLSKGLTGKLSHGTSSLAFNNQGLGGSVAENAIKLGTVALVGSYAKKNLNSTSWKKKVVGLALIYLAPMAIRFVRQKLEEYQKNRSVSSMEKLI